MEDRKRFRKEDILYEDNHLVVVNKRVGQLVHSDVKGGESLEEQVKEWIRVRDSKPGRVFLGVTHRLDQPVTGAVVLAKTSKSLSRINAMFKEREIDKLYWAILESLPEKLEAELIHHLARDTRLNTSKIYDRQQAFTKEAVLRYRVIESSDRYHLAEVDLITGRHHQIRAQISHIGSPIKGDLKYRAKRSNPDGGISLHARYLNFTHPISQNQITITAPPPDGDKLWQFFLDALS